MNLAVTLAAQLDTDLRAELADDLRDVLQDHGLTAAHPTPGGRAPAGTKSADLLTWGTVVVSVASATSVRPLVDALASWLRRQPQDISIVADGIELAGPVTPEQRAALVAAITERLRAGGAADPG